MLPLASQAKRKSHTLGTDLGWSESLDTHPQTQRRLQDVAGCSGISPQRLQELLGATQTAEERYSLALPDKVEEKVFSTAFKSKYIFRIFWALIGVVVGTPVLLALLAASLNPPGLFKWAAFIAGLCVTFALYQLFRNFAAFWGYTSGAHSLLRARREVKALHQQLQGWLAGAATHAVVAPPLSSLTSPDYSVVTSQRMSDRFTLRTFLLSTFQLTGFILLLSLGARLPLWSMGYAWGIVVGICLLDQLPKLFQRSAEKKTRTSPTDESSAETRTRPGGTWAESET